MAAKNIHNRLLMGDIELNEGMVVENAVAQMIRAAGHKLYFFSDSDRNSAKDRMEIDFLSAALHGSATCGASLIPRQKTNMNVENAIDRNREAMRLFKKINGEGFVCLTDMAKLRSKDAQQTISIWMRNRMTLEYLGLREELYNPDFKPLGFEGFRKEVGMTHQQWQAANPTLKGNRIPHGRARVGEADALAGARDYATINQLICISNMENINAVMINENAPQKRNAFRREAARRVMRASARAQRSGRKEPRIPQPQRLKKLNEIAIQQMRILSEVEGRKYLK